LPAVVVDAGFAIDVTPSMVCLSVWLCSSQPWAMQKWLNRSRCHFVCGMMGEICMGPRNHVFDGDTYGRQLANTLEW